MRTYVSLFTSADGRIYLSLPDLGVEKTWMLKDLLKAGDKLAGNPLSQVYSPTQTDRRRRNLRTYTCSVYLGLSPRAHGIITASLFALLDWRSVQITTNAELVTRAFSMIKPVFEISTYD